MQGQSLLLEDNNLSVPSDIAGLVEGVSGVSATLAHPDRQTGAPSNASTSQPPQIRSAYNLNNQTDGSGVTVAIVDAYASPTTGDCTTRNVALNARRGYDNMTGLGAPTAGFVPALARR